MARVLVVTEGNPANAQILMDEEVRPVHLEDEHSREQVLERLIWAVVEAATVTDDRRPAAHSSYLAAAG